MVFSPNGEMLAIALEESFGVEVRRVKDGSTVRDVKYYYPESMAFSHDNSLIAVGGHNQERIKIWRLADGQLLHSFEKSETKFPLSHVDFLAFGSEDKILVTRNGRHSSPLHKISAWNLENQEKLYTLPGVYNCAAASADGKLLAVAGSKEPLTLYRLKDGTRLQQIKTNPVYCYNLEFSGDGKSLMLDAFGNVEIYNVQDGKLINKIRPVRDLLYDAEGTGDAVFSLNGRYFATAHFVLSTGGSFEIIALPSRRLAAAGHVRFWDAKAGRRRVIKKVRGDKDVVRSLAFSPDGKFLASAGKGGTIRFWRMPPRNYGWLWLLSAAGLAVLLYWRRTELISLINRY